MTTERIQIIVSSKGEVTVRKNISSLGTASERAARQVDTLKSSLKALIAGLGVAEILRFADSYQNLTNRLRLVTNGTDDLRASYERLLTISQKTRADFAGTVNIYQRLAQSNGNLHATQEQLFQVVTTLNQAIAVSGATASEAAGGLRQLSQAFASGQLRGDELRSVLENFPALGQIIANSLHKTVGELYALGEAGQAITSKQVFKAILDAGKSVEQQFQETVTTLGQAFIQLKNGFTDLLRDLNQTTSVFTLLAQSISFVGTHMDTLGPAITLVAGAFALLAGAKGIGMVITALHSLTAALIANPITALPTLLALATSAIITFHEELGLTTENFAKFGNTAGQAMADLENGLISVINWFSQLIETLSFGLIKLGEIKKVAVETAAAVGAVASASTGAGGGLGGVGGFSGGGGIGGAAGASGGRTVAGSGPVPHAAGDVMFGPNGANGGKSASAGSSGQTIYFGGGGGGTVRVASLGFGSTDATRALQTGGSNFSGPHAFARGGSFVVGGAGGIDSKVLQARVTPGERVTIETPEQVRAGNRGGSSPRITNVIDPRNMLPVMSSREGQDEIINVIRYRANDVAAALGRR